MTTSLFKPIGGFHEIELHGKQASYHPKALALTSGRACLHFILKTIKPRKVYVPFYICDSVLAPLKRLKIAYEFYGFTSAWEISPALQLENDEYILGVNYFGIHRSMIDKLYQQFGLRVIIDNTQAFFETSYQNCWSFNSARKFFGVPDGAYLYAPEPISSMLKRNDQINYAHLIERLMEKESAYASFQKNEAEITDDLLSMSILSEKLLNQVEYSFVMQKRRENFACYHQAFSSMNQLPFSLPLDAIPFCYPLQIDFSFNRSDLYQLGIFIPSLWPDVLHRNQFGFEFEKSLTRQLLPLPIDHRYELEDCSRVIETILKKLS